MVLNTVNKIRHDTQYKTGLFSMLFHFLPLIIIISLVYLEGTNTLQEKEMSKHFSF